MDTHTQQNPSGEKSMVIPFQVSLLEAQVRECFGRCAWTHKAHLKCSDIINEVQSRVQISQIVLSTLTTTGVLVTVFGDNSLVGIVTAIISAIQVGVSAYVKGHDFGEVAQKHVDAASQIWDIRESYLSLLTDIKAGSLSSTEIQEKRDKFQDQLASIYRGSPRITTRGYKRVSQALMIKEELTFSDDEIDMWLPSLLRKTK